jgi:prepilin-type processing-associated H-X9-DG protein/prepilin-type N-terminal cleavage/methylation domain-containing protein
MTEGSVETQEKVMKFRRCCSSISLSAAGQRKRSASIAGFTLVELLVVIGIIALLISVLLPALSSARKQASKIKCAAALKDVGNAILMYVQDNNGWAPPAKVSGGPYTLSSSTAVFGTTAAPAAYWYNFLQKYETKTAQGYAATADPNANNAISMSQHSIFWGCPEWTPYSFNGSAASNPLNVSTQPGYGMNVCPEYTASYPPSGRSGAVSLGDPTATSASAAVQYTNAIEVITYNTPIASWTPPLAGKWYKYITYDHPSERCMMGDSLFWLILCRPPLSPTATPNMAAQYTLTNNGTWSNEPDNSSETTFDWYRHGTYPKPQNQDEFSVYGGKVAFNVLFCDGHVSTLIDKADAYRVVRMKYPN